MGTYIGAAATASATYATVAPTLGLPTLASLVASTGATAVLAAAVPAGPIIAAVVSLIKQHVKGIKKQWARREQCREDGWLWCVQEAAKSGGQPLGLVDDDDRNPGRLPVFPSAANDNCFGENDKEKIDGRLRYFPAGKIGGVAKREDVLKRSLWNMLDGEAFPINTHCISIFPQFGPFAYVNRFGQLQRVPGDLGHAACCAIGAEAAKAPSRKMYDVARRLRTYQPGMKDEPWNYLGSIIETYEELHGSPKDDSAEGEGEEGGASGLQGAVQGMDVRRRKSDDGAGVIAAAAAFFFLTM